MGQSIHTFADVVDKVITGDITETEYINNFTGFQTTDIDDIKNNIIKLQKSDKSIAFKFTIVSYMREMIYYKLLDVVDLDDNGISNIDINNESDSRERLMNKVIDLKTLVQNDLVYLKAFKSVTSYLDAIPPDQSNEILSDADIIWKEEIINRLILLVDRFGIEFIKSYDIELITIQEAFSMKYEVLTKYYMNVVKEIAFNLKNIEKLCNTYIDLERAQIMIKLTHNVDMNDQIMNMMVTL